MNLTVVKKSLINKKEKTDWVVTLEGNARCDYMNINQLDIFESL